MVGGLILVTGLWPRLGALITAIPTPIAQAMLAGVVLELCLDPVRGFAAHPWLVGPILLTWVILLRLARKWAVPAAFAVTLAVVGIDAAGHGGIHGALLPHLDWTTPAFTGAGLLSLALPLYVVTMAGQNVPGVAVMSSYGYQVPWRETMTVTGLGTAAGALGGGHAINLAAITAAMAASPDADPDPGRRWIASWTSGWAYLVLAMALGRPDHVRQRRPGRRDRRRGGARAARHALGFPLWRPVRTAGPRGAGDHLRHRRLRADLPRHRRRILGPCRRTAGPGGAPRARERRAAQAGQRSAARARKRGAAEPASRPGDGRAPDTPAQ